MSEGRRRDAPMAEARRGRAERVVSRNPVLQLQRLAGNRAVSRMLGRMPSTSVIQRNGAWPFSQENSKAEFTRRTDIDNSLFVALAALTGRALGRYPVIDIARVEHSDYATLGRAMRAALATARTRDATPYHQNAEGKLPGFGTRLAYMELSYFGGGTRLVVDFLQNIVYISAHYRSFYVLEDGGGPPAGLLATAKAAYFEDQKSGIVDALEGVLRRGGNLY